MRSARLLERIIGGDVSNVRFTDLLRLVRELGFQLDRGSGSHRIFSHPEFREKLNLQMVEGQAKPYQVKQVVKLITKYNLRLTRRHG